MIVFSKQSFPLLPFFSLLLSSVNVHVMLTVNERVNQQMHFSLYIYKTAAESKATQRTFHSHIFERHVCLNFREPFCSHEIISSENHI